MTYPTLVMERLMLDPRYAEIVERLRRAAPAGARDQADAAVAETLSIVHQLAPLVGADAVRAGEPVDFPGWLRLSVLDALSAWLTGQAETCRHGPVARSPQPVIAAAWRPGLIACRLCPHLLSLRRGTAADARCDHCGHHCAGVDQDDPIYPSIVQLGPVLFMYGTCGDCRPDTGSLPVVPRLRATPRGSRGRKRGRL